MTKPLAQRPVDPNSICGAIAAALYEIILAHRKHPEVLRAAAPVQRLTDDQLLAAVLTERILDVLRLDGDVPAPRKGVAGEECR